MQLNGSEIVVECLKEQGVDTVFGYPGGTILNIYDALYKHSDEIRHVLTSHEQGAAHAADGYARATGRVGVCMATSGPGATNLVTGIATAYMDSVPLVAITANVNLPLLGKDTFEEIDIAGVTMPITKHSFIVKNVNDLAPTIRKAFRIARGGRPGPVLVDITKDVTAAVTEYTREEIDQTMKRTVKASEDQIDEAIRCMKEAKKPFIYLRGPALLPAFEAAAVFSGGAAGSRIRGSGVSAGTFLSGLSGLETGLRRAAGPYRLRPGAARPGLHRGVPGALRRPGRGPLGAGAELWPPAAERQTAGAQLSVGLWGAAAHLRLRRRPQRQAEGLRADSAAGPILRLHRHRRQRQLPFRPSDRGGGGGGLPPRPGSSFRPGAAAAGDQRPGGPSLRRRRLPGAEGPPAADPLLGPGRRRDAAGLSPRPAAD